MPIEVHTGAPREGGLLGRGGAFLRDGSRRGLGGVGLVVGRGGVGAGLGSCGVLREEDEALLEEELEAVDLGLELLDVLVPTMAQHVLRRLEQPIRGVPVPLVVIPGHVLEEVPTGVGLAHRSVVLIPLDEAVVLTDGELPVRDVEAELEPVQRLGVALGRRELGADRLAEQGAQVEHDVDDVLHFFRHEVELDRALDDVAVRDLEAAGDCGVHIFSRGDVEGVGAVGQGDLVRDDDLAAGQVDHDGGGKFAADGEERKKRLLHLIEPLVGV